MDHPVARVAILGGTGFAGRNVTELLQQAGHTVDVFSRRTGCDLLDLPAAKTCLGAFRPTHLVNCAAMVGSLNYVTDFAADVVDVNMRLILNAYRIASEISEVTVINPIANCAYPGAMDLYEESRFWNGPIHSSVLSYGSSRRMMLVVSKCYSDQYRVRSVNLLVPNMYGSFDSTDPNKTHALNALVIKLLLAMKEGRPRIDVWGTGKPIREWLYVKDFAAIVRLVVESEKVRTEPVNVAQKRGFSIRELVDMLATMVGFRGEIIYDTHYQDGSAKKVMDDTRFRQWYPEFQFTPLEQGLRETVAYYQSVL